MFFTLAALVINQAAGKEKIYKQILTENTKCERARYAGKTFPMAHIIDGQEFSGEHLLTKFAEKEHKVMKPKHCMRRCFRYAGCVAFNYHYFDDFDICELFSAVGPTIENKANVTRGFFSADCDVIDDFYDYRMSREVSIIFKKVSEFVDDELRTNLLSDVLTVNNLRPDMNNEWNLTALGRNGDKGLSEAERFKFQVTEFPLGEHTMCHFKFEVDRVVRVNSQRDNTEYVNTFFGSDDVFVANLFKIAWPKNIELYDIEASPSDIKIVSSQEYYGMKGRKSDRVDGKCTALAGELKCTCGPGLFWEDGACKDIDECNDEDVGNYICGKNQECYNQRGSFNCISYPEHSEGFKSAAAQRIAILIARQDKLPKRFDYSSWVMNIILLMDEIDNVSVDGNCTNPFNYDHFDSAYEIARARDTNVWFQQLYEKVFWVFKDCKKYGRVKEFFRKVRRLYRQGVRSDKDVDMFGELNEAHMLAKFTSTDYDEENYEEYFQERSRKLESSLISAPRKEDHHKPAQDEFASIDWSWTSDYNW